MRWRSHPDDRMVERELRRSRTRAAAAAVLAGVTGALLYALVGQPWPAGALLCAAATLLGALAGPSRILRDAGGRDRRR